MMPALALIALAAAGPPRAGVELRLDAMERAALAGDADAWMAAIAPWDATLAVEQRRFADDLRANPPLEFDLSIADDPPPVFEEARALVGLVVRYRAPSGHAAAGKRAAWPAVFVLADPDGEGPRAPGWLYQGEQWLVMQADGFEVRCLPGGEEAARDILGAFPVARGHDDEFFGIVNDTHQVIKLYNDMEHLKATVYLTMPDEVLGGWNEAGESIKFMSSYTRGVDGWTAAMAHEYGHVATWELGPRAGAMPWWVQEGAAELAAEAFLPGSAGRLDAMMRERAAAGTLPAFDEISDYRTTRAPLKIMAYHQGHHMVGFISARFGAAARNRWLAEMASGARLDGATLNALGLSFADLEARWRGSLRTEPPADPLAWLEPKLDAMEAAVLAGDAGAYLVHVDTADPEFMREQQNWAADLARHTPERFGLALDGAVIQGDRAEANLTMTWAMQGAAPRSVHFPVCFRQVPGGPWLYAGERWEEVAGERVLALCAPGLEPAGRRVVDAFPEVRRHVEEGFGLAIDRVQKIKLYATMEHLQASIYLSYTDGLGGWNEPGEAIKILASRDHRSGFSVLLAHEFGHVCTFEMGPNAGAMPWWAIEGAAELAAEGFSGTRERNDRYIRGLAAGGELGDWAAMADFRDTPRRQYHLVYPQGHHMLGYISDQFGRDGRNRWLREMARGASLDEASRGALGLSFADLDSAWRASIREAAGPGDEAER